MKLLYTDIQYDMTEILVGEAVAQAEAGKRVFTLLPTLYLLKKKEQFWSCYETKLLLRLR